MRTVPKGFVYLVWARGGKVSSQETAPQSDRCSAGSASQLLVVVLPNPPIGASPHLPLSRQVPCDFQCCYVCFQCCCVALCAILASGQSPWGLTIQISVGRVGRQSVKIKLLSLFSPVPVCWPRCVDDLWVQQGPVILTEWTGSGVPQNRNEK